MINMEGVLTIRVINGRNGAFSVGELETSIGKFAVKDVTLDQYDQGTYKGLFTVARILPSNYTPRGSCYTIHEIRAYLDSFTLYDIDNKPVDDIPLVEDPLEEESVPAKNENQRQSEQSVCAEKKQIRRQSKMPINDDDFDESKLSDLFGILYPLGVEIKLDSTCGREIFRQQKNYLKQNGYSFIPMKQIWVKD